MSIQLNKQFFFLGGLPRSGSTVLASILNQNPGLFTTPNSPLFDLLMHIDILWPQFEQTKAYEFDNQKENILKSTINGCWSHIDKPIIIDKCRAWPGNIQHIKRLFEYDSPKIICTVRDIPSTMASFIKLIRKNDQNNFIDQNLLNKNIPLTDENRCELLIRSGGIIFESYKALKIAFENGFGKHILLIEYDDIVSKPKEVLTQIYNFLEIPQFDHAFENIENLTPENDNVYGLNGMHSIETKLHASSISTAESILGKDLFKKYQGAEFWRKK